MRRFLAALAAALANLPRLVWEGGKLVARTFFPGQPQQAEAAEQELIEELMRPRSLRAVETGYETPDEAWGRAAGDHLIPCGEPLHRPEAILDDRAIAYLDSLDLHERAALLAFEARHIGQFLLGERTLKGLPPVPTREQWTGAEKARLAVLAGPLREQREALQAKVDGVVAVMKEQGYTPTYRAA